MISTRDAVPPVAEVHAAPNSANESSQRDLRSQDFRLRAQQLALREQIERNHFLLERLSASSTRLLQSLDSSTVFEAIAEIIANLVGSEQVAIFYYAPERESFQSAWSCGVEPSSLERVAASNGMLRRTARKATTQFREIQDAASFLPGEINLTACIALKSGQDVIGAIAIFDLLPQKQRLEWADFELFKFLEVYAAYAIEIQRLREKRGAS